MERDFLRPLPTLRESESARELGILETKTSPRSESAAPSPGLLGPLSFPLRSHGSFSLSKVSTGRSGIPVGFIRRPPWAGLKQSKTGPEKALCQ